jgi:imidazolonepropionase
MKKLLIKNIKQLVQVRENNSELLSPLKGKEQGVLPILEDAWLAIEDDLIVGYGLMENWEGINDWSNLTIIDAEDRLVLPTWCDSHSHIVYAHDRSAEFVDRINGLTYQEIAANGGGILNSAKHIASASSQSLLSTALYRCNEVLALGTGALEIKSGYGLDLENEIKMLEVIEQLKALTPISIKATLLAAHAVPEKYKSNKKEYIKIIVNELIPAVAEKKLAEYCDVFCEENYFTKSESLEILACAKQYGFKIKVHANQLSHSGGVEVGTSLGAVSVDHLEYVKELELEQLKNSSTIATVLPGAAYFLSLPLPPAKTMIQHNIPVAVASDYNPGSSPTGNMNLMLSMLCINYKLTPQEAINAATYNAAFAMNLNQTHGSITIGKKANVIITKPISGYSFIPYSFGNNLIDKVILNGVLVHDLEK